MAGAPGAGMTMTSTGGVPVSGMQMVSTAQPMQMVRQSYILVYPYI